MAAEAGQGAGAPGGRQAGEQGRRGTGLRAGLQLASSGFLDPNTLQPMHRARARTHRMKRLGCASAR